MPRVPEEHMQERRVQIAEAALRCFRTKGIAETRMRDIFQESGLSAGAVYNHFPSKAELIEYLARESEEKWLEIFAHYRQGADQDPKAALKALLTSMIEDLSRPELVSVLAGDIGIWAFSIHKESLRSSCRELFLSIAAGFDGILAGDREPAAEVSPPEPTIGAPLLAHLQGLALQAAMGMNLDLQREVEYVSVIIDHFDQGIEAC